MKQLAVTSLALFAAAAAWIRPAPGISGDVREFLSHVSIIDMPNGNGGTVRTVRIEGLNVQIVNGTGTTDSKNGSGNLLLGYNENGWTAGSHGLIAGRTHHWDSYGGALLGAGNGASGMFCSVLGGAGGSAVGGFSVVVGGTSNEAHGSYSVVGGGYARFTTDIHDFAAGGLWQDN